MVDQIEVQDEKLRENISTICRNFLGGPWEEVDSSDLIIRKVYGGLSNRLYFCFLPSTKKSPSLEPNETVLHLYGSRHFDSISILNESVITVKLSGTGLAPKVYGVFPEGRLEEVIHGHPLTYEEVSDNHISAAIAKKLARIHSLQLPISKETFSMKLKRYLKLKHIRNIKNLKEEHRKIAEELRAYDFEQDIDWLNNLLEKMDSPKVFSHNDLTTDNILLKDGAKIPTEEDIVFIDFEFCCYNYRAADFATIFIWWSFVYDGSTYPYFSFKKENYPSDEQQKLFIHSYVEAMFPDMDENSQIKEVEQILKEVSVVRIFRYLFGIIWVLCLTNFNNLLVFGHWEYAKECYTLYLSEKSRISSDSEELCP